MLDHLFRRWNQEQQERQELIALDIHDGACQYAAAARMAFEAHRREKTEAGTDNWSNFDSGMAFLDNAIDELRRLVRGLQPIHLAAGDLATAIACLIEEIQKAGGP